MSAGGLIQKYISLIAVHMAAPHGLTASRQHYRHGVLPGKGCSAPALKQDGQIAPPQKLRLLRPLFFPRRPPTPAGSATGHPGQPPTESQCRGQQHQVAQRLPSPAEGNPLPRFLFHAVLLFHSTCQPVSMRSSSAVPNRSQRGETKFRISSFAPFLFKKRRGRWRRRRGHPPRLCGRRPTRPASRPGGFSPSGSAR